MITRSELLEAKTYAGLPTNTDYQKRRLISLYIKSEIGVETRVYPDYTTDEQTRFELAFLTAKQFFEHGVPIENNTE